MKTTKQWLNELPEPHKTRALANYDSINDKAEELEDSLSEAILGAFYWKDTSEGLDYWDEIANGNYDAKPATKQP